jgi:uncharacterized protein
MKAIASSAGVFLLLVVALSMSAVMGQTQEPGLFTIGTAARGGVYYPVGSAICRFVNAGRERHGLRCLVAPSAGSVANIGALRSGEWAYVIVQSDVQHAAFTGHNQFVDAGPLSSLRAVFSLHGEPFTVMAREDSGIRTLADARGRRVNLGREGSGMRATAEDVLTAFGWQPSEFPQLAALAPEEQEKALCQNEIDVATFVVGHPSGWIQDIKSTCDARVVPVTGPAIDALLKASPFYAPTSVPAQMYDHHPEDISTLGVRALLVTLNERPAAEVYELVKAVFEGLRTFRRLHPALADLKPEEMVSLGITVPLHPGAERYFREAGLR